MSVVESEPQALTAVSTHSARELAGRILMSLDTLTLGSPSAGLAEFADATKYEEYLNGRRFVRGPEKIHCLSIPVLRVIGRSLLNDGMNAWNVAAFRTDNTEDTNGYYQPNDPNSAYHLELLLRRDPFDTTIPARELIIFDSCPTNPQLEPLVRHLYLSRGKPREITVPHAASYDCPEIFVARDVAAELGREAQALLDIRQDNCNF